MKDLTPIADNIWIQRHPLSVMGLQTGRVVTVVKLKTGKLLIHSTAPFAESHLAGIREIGEPGYLFEATNFHDTHSFAGRKAFPDIPYLVPPDFPKIAQLNATPFASAKEADFEDEFQIVPIGGLKRLGEVALLHQPSKTLIIADLLFNFPDSMGKWSQWLLRTVAKLETYPGQSAFFRRFIRDEAAYRDSIAEIAELDFETIIFGHGDPISSDGNAIFRDALGL